MKLMLGWQHMDAERVDFWPAHAVAVVEIVLDGGGQVARGD